MPLPFPLPPGIGVKAEIEKLRNAGNDVADGTIVVNLDVSPPRLEVWTGSIWERMGFSEGPVLGATVEAPTASSICVGRARAAGTVKTVRGWQNAGTGCVINAFKGSLASPSRFLSTNLTIGTADSWESSTADQNTAVAAGDAIYIELITIAGSPDRLAIQVEMDRP